MRTAGYTESSVCTTWCLIDRELSQKQALFMQMVAIAAVPCASFVPRAPHQSCPEVVWPMRGWKLQHSVPHSACPRRANAGPVRRLSDLEKWKLRRVLTFQKFSELQDDPLEFHFLDNKNSKFHFWPTPACSGCISETLFKLGTTNGALVRFARNENT